MSHEISIQNGVAEIVCGQNQVPWHKLGEVVAGLLTASDALQKAHLTWNVEPKAVTVNGVTLSLDDYQGICRADTGACLGIVKGRYTPIQNAQAFDFFDSICGQGEAVYDTAGALRGGKQVWLLAKVDGNKRICGDEYRTYALMRTAHDGSCSTEVMWVTERVVCANTMAIALRGADNIIKIRHTKNWKEKAEQASRTLMAGQKYFASVGEALSKMGDQLLTKEQMAEFTKVLVPVKVDPENPDKIPTRTQNIRAEIDRLFDRGAGNKGLTRYDAFQAVTDYADHSQTIRGENTRLESALLGSGAQLKQNAFDLLTSEKLMEQLMSKSHTINPAPTVGSTTFAELLAR